MAEIIVAIILFAVSLSAFFMSFFSFMQKGFLFNNAYIHATEKERNEMNKKPYYRQTAIVFILFGAIFSLNALDVLLKTKWIFYTVILLVIITMVYAIVSSISIKKRNK